MQSLRELFRIGPGPSSSHTIAPTLAAESFRRRIADKGGDRIEVTLYGSLALTGQGHGTESAIRGVFAGNNIIFKRDLSSNIPHANYLCFSLFSGDKLLDQAHYTSVGGGELRSEEDPTVNAKEVYPFHTFEEIKTFMKEHGEKDLVAFGLRFEDVREHLSRCLDTMFATVERGLNKEGAICVCANERLRTERVAKKIFEKAQSLEDSDAKTEMLISAYAYAVAEENATGGEIVTAPTGGSAGVLPAALYFLYKNKGINKEILVGSLYVAGVFGNIIKQNATIAGSVGGCQAEIGAASAMAAAALAYVDGLSLYQQEYAAECALEHFLGLTCDPVDGYVVVPCIERNGIGALRAYNAFLYAKHIAPLRKNLVSFDNVVSAMKMTGDSLPTAYKETAIGGLADVLKDTNRGTC